MQSDHRAAVVSPMRQTPRLLERMTDESACQKQALSYQPTQKMIKAALLSGWPIKYYSTKE
jgi:hypothetical protein